jgi:hypothetical protein
VAVPGFKSRDSRPKNINYSLNSDLVNAEFEITKKPKPETETGRIVLFNEHNGCMNYEHGAWVK